MREKTKAAEERTREVWNPKNFLKKSLVEPFFRTPMVESPTQVDAALQQLRQAVAKVGTKSVQHPSRRPFIQSPLGR